MATPLQLLLVLSALLGALAVRPLEAEGGLSLNAERPRKSAFATSIIVDPNYEELMWVGWGSRPGR